MKRLSIYLFYTSILFQTALAGNTPMKYGKPELSELEMTVYSPDSSASAVVLCNYGYFNATQFQFVHQTRIKILKETGKSHGNFYVPAAEKTNVKGQVVNMENGKPVITKLTKEGIFIERVTRNQFRARVAMPNVKAGSVIDVEFFYPGLPYYWEFQKSIPVKWSELTLEESPNVSFRKNLTGYIPVSIAKNDKWSAGNVPAFIPESYINNYENYLSRMQIEVQSIQIPGLYYKEYATNWEAVAKNLQTHNEFGLQLTSPNLYLNDLEREIKKSSKSPYERLEKAFAAIKKFKWNTSESIWPSSGGISYTYSKKTGNSADINMSLVILLRKLDIEAYPILLSSRDNGLLPQYSVSFDKLNYFAVKALINDTSYLLDATEEYLEINMLPERALNGRGLVILKDGFDWIDLTAQKKDKTNNIVNCNLFEDGTLQGEWFQMKSEYAAFDQREKYKSFNSEDEYLKDLESKHNGLSIESYSNIGLDSLGIPLSESMKITFKNKATKVGDQLFFNPFLFERFNENPFKAAERLYPVDFVTATDQRINLTVKVPDGWQVQELPKSVRMALPDKSAAILFSSAVINNLIQISFKLNINKAVFIQTEYNDLKAFFDELVKKESEMIVLKKI